MIWAILALSGRILMLGYERIVVKQLGENSDSLGATFLFFGIATVFLFPVLFFVPFPDDLAFLWWVLLASSIYSIAFILYVRSLALGEASRVGPLYNFNVFFLVVLTSVFLGEEISLAKAGGIILLFYGTSFLNRQKNPLYSFRLLFSDKASQLMIFCSLLMAFGRTIDGFSVRQVSPVFYSFSLYSGITLFLLLYILISKKWKMTISLVKEKTSASVLSGAVNAYSYLLLVFAFTKIDVSIAEPASMLSMIITVIFAHFIFGEKIRDRLIAVLIMIAGAWLLTV